LTCAENRISRAATSGVGGPPAWTVERIEQNGIAVVEDLEDIDEDIDVAGTAGRADIDNTAQNLIENTVSGLYKNFRLAAQKSALSTAVDPMRADLAQRTTAELTESLTRFANQN
jgi:hypothetical protein